MCPEGLAIFKRDRASNNILSFKDSIRTGSTKNETGFMLCFAGMLKLYGIFLSHSSLVQCVTLAHHQSCNNVA